MAITAPARPDLDAHRHSIQIPINQAVGELADILGKKLTAYLAGVKDTRTIDAWSADRGDARKLDEQRIRLALQVALMLRTGDHPRVVQSWFVGINPQLDDRSPARILREGDIDKDAADVVAAARAFLAGG
ncbi:MAG: hypothetical protein NVSMB64_33260 [Candidatus Velthaea sp.]